MDSIKQALSNNECSGKDNLINRIRLFMNADIEQKKTIVLVEGPDDVKFFKSIMEDSIGCFESYSGKRGLYELLEVAELSDKRIIAVRDRDYSTVDDYPERMFAYDYCALELMMLHHPQVQKRMMEFCICDNYKKEFPVKIMRHIAPFSILRRNNEREHLSICLNKGVLYGLQESSGQLPDMQVLFKRLNVDEQLFNKCKSEAEISDDDYLWDITNGHDICAILGRLSENCGSRLNEKRYRSAMFIIYRLEDFYDTQLCKQLMKYQRQNGLSILGNINGGESNEI